MPHFYGHDYYLLAIADHAARLNKAILPIPQPLQKHVKDCCLNVLDILEADGKKEFPDLFESDLQDVSRDVLGVQVLQCETLEVYENNVITGHDGEELFEIIPSSNPESICSLIASFDKDESIANHGEPSCYEQFDSVTSLTEKPLAFDEPVNVNDFRLAILALPSLPVLLSRLKSVNLEDPLLTPDGTKWKDNDFQCTVDSHGDWSTDVSNVEEVHSCQEIFNTFSMETNKDMSSEPLLPYNVPSTEQETTAADMNNCDYTAALTQGDCGIEEEEDLLTEDIEHVISQLTSGFSNTNMVCSMDDAGDDNDDDSGVYNKSTTSLSALEHFVKSSDCYPQEVLNNCSSQKCLSPFVEHRNVEIVNDEDDLLSKYLLECPLGTLAAEEILWSKCSLLDEDLNAVERCIWEEDKHFDEIHFFEPLFKQESFPNPITEASVSLGLQPEDIKADNECLKWSFDVQQEGSSFCGIAVLSEDVSVHQLDDHEVFDKFQTSELDYMLTCSSEQSKSIVLNDCMQDATSECVDSHTTDVSDEDHGFQPVDPLDSFIYVRARSVRSRGKHVQSSPQYCDKRICTNGNSKINVLTSAAASSPNKQCANIKTVEADFSGLWENVLQCIIDSAGVHLENMKREAVIPRQQELMDISIDMTRFLLKEREKQMADVVSEGNAHTSYTQRDSLLQSLAIVHILRTAADLLLHACLESCITYLAANSEDKPATIAKSCIEVHQQLLNFQCQFLQENRTHPKLSILINEVAKCSIELPGSKILILVQKGLNSLVCAVESALCQIPQLTVIVVKDWKCVETSQKTTAFIASVAEARDEMMQLFSLAILYDERHNVHIKSWCQDKGISYIGLLTQYSCGSDFTDKPDTVKKMPQTTLICSMEVTQYTQLVYLLETGYNILVIEREYHKLCGPDTKIYFADLIVSATHCIVLLSLQDMRRHWDLTTVITRCVALGLQFSHCCIILHGMDAGTSYVLEKETLSNIYKLTAALCNLKGATAAFEASFKVLISLTDKDVAACIRDIVDHFLAQNSETDLLRPWLSADASQNEAMLLQLNCMNSFSAQKLLHKLSIREILEKSDGELTVLFPDIPEKIFKYLHYVTLSLKCQPSWLPTNFQNSCFAEVCSSNNLAMKTQTNSSLSRNMNDDDIQQTSTATSDFDNIRRVNQQPVQTEKFVQSLGTNAAECFSPAQANLGTKYTHPDNLIRDQNYNFAAEEHRRKSVQQRNFSESVACSNADLCLQSLAGPGECDDPLPSEEQMCNSGYVKCLSGTPQDYQNNGSVCGNANTAGEILTADHQKVCYSPQQINHAQRSTVSNRPTLTYSDASNISNNRYHSGLLEGSTGNYQAKPLQEYTTLRNGHYRKQELQTKSNLQSPSTSVVLRSTSGDEDSIQCFHRKIARAMQTLDIQSSDQEPSSRSCTWMPRERNEREPQGHLKPHTTDHIYKDTGFELTECSLSPILRQTEPASNVGHSYAEYSTQDGSVFNFPISVTADKEESTSGGPLFYDPVKKETEDVIYDNSRLNMSEESTTLNSAAMATQKPTYSLRNDSRFHKYEMDSYEDKAYKQNYDPNHFPPSFLNDEGNSIFRLSDYLFASDQAPFTDPQSHSTGTHFGLFSTKAQRHRNIFSTSDENRSQSPNNTTVATSEYPTTGGNLVHDTQTYNFKQSCNGLLATGDVTDRTKNLDLLPFSVSKELRKHIKKHITQDLHNASRFLTQGNQNSVRVSRQPHYGNSETHLNNRDGLAASVHSQMRNAFKQQEIQNCTSKSGTSLLQNIDHMRNPDMQEFQNYAKELDMSLLQNIDQKRHPITHQDFHNYRRESDSALLENGGQIKHAVIQQDFHNCRREPDTTLLENVGQIRHPVIQQGFHNCRREPGTTLLENVGHKRQAVTQDFHNCRREPDTALLENIGQITLPVIQQEFHNCRREPDPLLLQNVVQMRNVVTEDFQNYAKEPDTALHQNTNHTQARNLLTSDCIQPTSRYSSRTTGPTQLIPSRQTQLTATSASNMQANNCQSLASSYSVASSRTNSPPGFARSITGPGLFQHCPPTNSSGIKTVKLTRDSSMPYTPRHRVTVGLAQPFRRQNGSVGSINLEAARQHSGGGTSHRADESPPMDLVPDDDGTNSRNDEQAMYSNTCISEVKRNKWNQHLLSCQATLEDRNKPSTSNGNTHSSAGGSSVTRPTPTRKRKLQLEKRAGNQGQTILVFK